MNMFRQLQKPQCTGFYFNSELIGKFREQGNILCLWLVAASIIYHTFVLLGVVVSKKEICKKTVAEQIPLYPSSALTLQIEFFFS